MFGMKRQKFQDLEVVLHTDGPLEILHLAQELHACETGASEGLSNYQIEKIKEAFQEILDTWEPSSHERYVHWDEAVRQVILAALEYQH